MKRTQLIVLAGVLAAGPIAAAADRPQSAPSAASVKILRREWTDTARKRIVPVKIYYPVAAARPLPVIIFSHGLGGSREGYEYLGRYWAAHGYVSVHLQHKGSDTEVWKGKAEPLKAMRRAAADLRNATNRPLDVRFAIDRMEKMNRDETPLRGRLDLKAIGAAGHSFGAYTTLAVAGQDFSARPGRRLTLADPRVKAAIAMSAPVPRQKDRRERAFASITIPCLHMTGTRDKSLVGSTSAAERRIPFDAGRAPHQYLIVFAGGDHMIFSGRRFSRRPASRKSDARFHELIRRSSLAFWNAYLKKDAKAEAWLAGGGFEALLGRDGTFEKRLKQTKP